MSYNMLRYGFLSSDPRFRVEGCLKGLTSCGVNAADQVRKKRVIHPMSNLRLPHCR